MIKKVKQTPLTLEAFEKVIMPKINERFDELNERIKYLPTTEVYLKSQDELMGELQKLREETALTGLHYDDTNARIDKIDNYLNYNSNIL